MSLFKKAERRQAKLKIAISGPSGSGKTMSALRLAKAIGGRVAVIDSENGSASLYADKYEFDTLALEPPFTAEKYVEAINAAEKEGYDIIVVDSFSHAWAGEGGTLDKKGALDARGGSQFGNWRNPKADYAKIKNALLHSSAHVIATIRSKQAYAISDDNGKSSVRRLGMDPIAEPGIEYEFTVMFEVAIDHNAQATKDRTSLFNNQVFLITEETGKTLMAWLGDAKPEEPKAARPAQTQAEEPKAAFCEICSTQLQLSPKSGGYYCPKFKDKARGEHTYVPGPDLDGFIKRQTAERDQAFEEPIPSEAS